MSIYAAAVVGALVSTVIWLFITAWLTDRLGAQRLALTCIETRLRLYMDTAARQAQQLADAQTTIRLYRISRDESDAHVRVLLGQVDRLARKVIDQAADASAREDLESAPVLTLPAHRYPTLRES